MQSDKVKREGANGTRGRMRGTAHDILLKLKVLCCLQNLYCRCDLAEYVVLLKLNVNFLLIKIAKKRFVLTGI